MHLYLEHLSIFTLNDLTQSEENCISLFQAVGSIPNNDDRDAPACPKCRGRMCLSTQSDRRLGWGWSCEKRHARVACCNTRMSPLKHTFFENTHLSFRDALGLIIGFVMDMKMIEIQRQITEWRFKRGEKNPHIHSSSVAEFHNKLKHICETTVTRNSALMEGMGKKKSLLDCYRLKRLRALTTFGERIYAILMDMKFVYPCPGKKDLIQETPRTLSLDKNVASLPLEKNEHISSVNSLNEKSAIFENEDVLLETSRIVKSPSIAAKTANYSFINENMDFLNDANKNSDASLFDHENSGSLNTSSEDVCVSSEPEKPTSTDNMKLLHMNEKTRITFSKRMPLHKNTQCVKSVGSTLSDSKEKYQNISAAIENYFLSNKKEKYSVPAVNCKNVQLPETIQHIKSLDQTTPNSKEADQDISCAIEKRIFSPGEKNKYLVPSVRSQNVELSENIQYTKSLDYSSVNSNEIDLDLFSSVKKAKFPSIRKEKCGVLSVSSKEPKLSGNLLCAESSDQSYGNYKKVDHIVSSTNEKNISAVEERIMPSTSSKNTKLFENKQCTKISYLSSTNSKKGGCGVLSTVAKTFSTSKKKNLIPPTSSKKVKLSENTDN